MVWLYLAAAVATVPPAVAAAVSSVRWVFASRAHKFNALVTIWVRIRWRWVTRNLELARVDTQKTEALKEQGKGGTVYLYPKRRIRADRYGFRVKVRTAPGISDVAWQDKAAELAHCWRVRRVQVSIEKPGRLLVRAVRRDPLADPLPMGACPQGTFDGQDVSRLYVGRDSMAQHRWLSIAGVPGVMVAGLPGYGKSSLINGWLYALIGSPAVAVSILDGKGGSDFEHLRDRCLIYTNDDLDRALAAAEGLYAILRWRMANIRRVLGVGNFWHRTPSPEFPLQLVVIDEAHGFFDKSAATSKDEQAKIARLTHIVMQLIKKGRSAGFVVVLASQKVTADSIPTAIRDVCSAYLSFAVRTRESAIAALGPDITEYPSVSPVGLLDRNQYVGVCTAALGDSDLQPFAQVRTPYVPDEDLQQRARETVEVRPSTAELVEATRWVRTAPVEPVAEWQRLINDDQAEDEGTQLRPDFFSPILCPDPDIGRSLSSVGGVKGRACSIA